MKISLHSSSKILLHFQISEIVGVPLVITDESTLNEMIEAGMPKFITQLEEINAGATKEHALEENLSKMKKEWIDITFELIPYRETGVHILTSLDDIQLMMDDHILKAQTMRGSPYVKAFEAEMTAWENKLISMQDIIEQWLMVSFITENKNYLSQDDTLKKTYRSLWNLKY